MPGRKSLHRASFSEKAPRSGLASRNSCWKPSTLKTATTVSSSSASGEWTNPFGIMVPSSGPISSEGPPSTSIRSLPFRISQPSSPLVWRCHGKRPSTRAMRRLYFPSRRKTLKLVRGGWPSSLSSTLKTFSAPRPYCVSLIASSSIGHVVGAMGRALPFDQRRPQSLQAIAIYLEAEAGFRRHDQAGALVDKLFPHHVVHVEQRPHRIARVMQRRDDGSQMRIGGSADAHLLGGADQAFQASRFRQVEQLLGLVYAAGLDGDVKYVDRTRFDHAHGLGKARDVLADVHLDMAAKLRHALIVLCPHGAFDQLEIVLLEPLVDAQRLLPVEVALEIQRLQLHAVTETISESRQEPLV